jgi:uncharacterized protein YjdB
VYAPLQSKLWGLAGDPLQLPRTNACHKAMLLELKLSRAFCPVAAVGHPNEDGAKQYAREILNQLENAIAGWTGPPKVKALTVSPNPLSLAKGDSRALSVKATFSDGTTGDAAGLVTWSSSSPVTVSVDPTTGMVKAVNTGPAVTVTAKADNEVVGSTTITVTPAEPRTVTVTPANPLLAVGKNLQLAATVTMSDGTRLSTISPSWASSNTSVATVSSKGVVRGAAVGTASISATYRDSKTAVTVSGSTTVTVLSGPPQITGFTPASGPVATQVTIRGANLLGVTSVSFGGTKATQVTVNSSSSITAVVPTGARTGFIAVTSPLGTTKSNNKLPVR